MTTKSQGFGHPLFSIQSRPYYRSLSRTALAADACVTDGQQSVEQSTLRIVDARDIRWRELVSVSGHEA
ncbi:hypothetical protein ACFSSC_07740 [Corynebacterium mendelii]|uniref:Uncharacterized protein n=1 Tax=Corynebacterium mendelii TaxID=2765362 RepID=A0A939E1L8_9CORY|nr:hypothetical protein [Corynebacterium mendelii]MBN9644774.1 hypothetical protein [Corynebacterium mendelii]